MTTDEAIQFLARHQPMPSDRDITDEDGHTFATILKLGSTRIGALFLC